MRSSKTDLLAISVFGFLAITAQGAESSTFEITPQESEILKLTNQARENAGLKPFTINNQLMELARAQSENMAYEEDLSHELQGRDLVLRTKESGYPYSYIGENIAESTYPIAHVITMWMSSEGHRKNILDSNFKEIGIGISVAPNGHTYFTQVFGAHSH